MKGDIKHCFWCKVSVVLFVWQYVAYVTHFKAFYILPISYMIHQKVFYFISELIFVLNRHKDTSLSTIEFIGSY